MKPSPDALRIFIIEDDPVYLRMVDYLLRLNPDHEVHQFTTGREALQALHLKPAIVVLDYALPDMTGADVLKRLVQHDPELPVIMLSGQKDIAVAVQLLKEGAYDYIVKDEESRDRLINLVHHVRQNRDLKQEVVELREELKKSFDFDRSMIGQSEPMRKVYAMLQKASQSDINVSLFGETGTGKDVAAKAIHYNSKRASGPFVAVNMAAIPPDLAESELFGHEKGSFTGALARRKGKFELAEKGTLFLDEIAELDLNLQAKLLRVIQEREVVRVGGEQPTKTDVRLIVATHRNLADEVRKGRFREDLYYRLIGMTIHLPPLRARGQDILMLAKHFLDSYSATNKLGKLKIADDAKRKLMAHSYPGNVRELKAAIELAAVMSDGQEIRSGDITFHHLGRETELLAEELTLDEYTQRIVNHFLEKYDHNVVQVAQKLGIGKSTLYRMLKQEKGKPVTG